MSNASNQTGGVHCIRNVLNQITQNAIICYENRILCKCFGTFTNLDWTMCYSGSHLFHSQHQSQNKALNFRTVTAHSHIAIV